MLHVIALLARDYLVLSRECGDEPRGALKDTTSWLSLFSGHSTFQGPCQSNPLLLGPGVGDGLARGRAIFK